MIRWFMFESPPKRTLEQPRLKKPTARTAVMDELITRRKILQTTYANMLAHVVENRDGDLILSPD